MFSRCLLCSTPFEENETLEHFPRGRRVAYDPVRGRLWAICRACKRWSLAPIEERWEALDELEKAVTDQARLLSQTENVALLRFGKLEIVRVGRARLAEEAWWRYGRVLLDRRKTYKKVSVAGSVAVGAALVGGWASGGIGGLAAWLIWEHAPDKITDATRWLRFGSAAWRGRRRCPHCGYLFTDLRFRSRGQVLLRPDADGLHPPARDRVGLAPPSNGEDDSPLALAYRCPRCRQDREGGLQLRGKEADRTLRRLLAYHHYAGASERRVRSATRLIEEVGRPSELSRILVKEGKALGQIKRTGAIALEIAANEESEQRLLELEVAELEARWRQEEELAAIVDGELTPLPILESLRRKVVGIDPPQ